MKIRILAISVLLVFVSAATFADFQIGAVAMYKGDPSTLSASGLGLQDFTFGLDTRLNLGILQGGISALYYPADITTAGPIPASLVALTDIGLCLDILFIRIGAGIGPSFSIPLESGAPVRDALPVGVNMKLAGDVMLGDFSLGLVFVYYVNSFSDFAEPEFFRLARPFIGVSVLYKLF
jgi:hypothetical protein